MRFKLILAIVLGLIASLRPVTAISNVVNQNNKPVFSISLDQEQWDVGDVLNGAIHITDQIKEFPVTFTIEIHQAKELVFRSSIDIQGLNDNQQHYTLEHFGIPIVPFTDGDIGEWMITIRSDAYTSSDAQVTFSVS